MILITGNLGFVGQHLIKELYKRNILWVGYDLVRGEDIRDKHQLDKCFELNQITHVIHLAALAGVRRSKDYPAEYVSTNITGTQNIVDMCEKHGVSKLIFFSSSSVYGNSDLPERGYDESCEKNPLSLYGITKLAGEQIVHNSITPSIIIRPFTIYGESGRKDEVVYRWLEQIKAGKRITVYDVESYRGYVYVKDLVKSVSDLIDRVDLVKSNFNVGGSEIVYLQDILDVFKEEFENLDIEYVERKKEDVKYNYANIDHAKKVLKFVPKPRFKQNLIKIIKTFKKENNL